MVLIMYEQFKNKGLSGLANIGNTCYLNSCIQILSNTYELNVFLDSYEGKNDKEETPSIFVEWNSLRRLMWSKNCVIAPHRFVSVIQNIASLKSRENFVSFNQNDVHEFWLFLIESLHNSLSRSVDMQVRGNPVTSTDRLAKACYKKMKDTYSDDYSEIINLFYGMEVTTITKEDSNKILSINPEMFSIISLPIPSKDDVSLYDCFDVYCAEEKMNGDNAWFNEKTNEKENVLRRVKFWTLPKVLVVNINRWTLTGRKNNNMVSIPLEKLDLRKHVEGYESEKSIYSLYGVCNHIGGCDGGHYTANIRNANGQWYKYNDTRVMKIQEDKVISGSSYCLFYRRI